MLTGTFELKIDDKDRIRFPSRWQSELAGEPLHVYYPNDGNWIYIFPDSYLKQRVDNKAETIDGQLLEDVVEKSTKRKLNGAGRITINLRSRRKALGDSVCLIGVCNHISLYVGTLEELDNHFEETLNLDGIYADLKGTH